MYAFKYLYPRLKVGALTRIYMPAHLISYHLLLLNCSVVDAGNGRFKFLTGSKMTIWL